MAAKKRLGEIMVESRLLQPDQLAKALEMQKTNKLPIGTILIKRGFSKKADVLKALGVQSGLEPVDLEGAVPPHNAALYVNSQFCEKNSCVPIEIDENAKPRKIITLAVSTVINPIVTEEIGRKNNAVIKMKVALHHQVDDLIKKVYYAQDFGYDLSFHESGGFRHAKPGEAGKGGPKPPAVETDQNALSHPFDEEAKSAPPRPRLANNDKEIDALREQVNTLQLHLNAVIRVLARKGQITRDEFAAELEKMTR